MVRLFDNTLRDGGNVVGHGFPISLTQSIIGALLEAGIPDIECGNCKGLGAYAKADAKQAPSDEEYFEAVQPYVKNDSLGWLQGLRYITPAHPQDVWVSGLLRRKLGRHVGLPGRSVSATGAKTHYCGRRCLHAPRIAGVCSSDAGDLQQSSGEMSLGLGYIPLNAGTTKPAGNYTRSKSPWLLEVVLCRN